MTLTKDSLAEGIKHHMDVSLRKSRSVLELLLEELKTTLEQGEEVKIANFGKWKVRAKNTRVGRNPNTGVPMEIDARRVVTFHPSEKLKKHVNTVRETRKRLAG